MLNEGIGMIFFSDKLYDFISDMNDIQFDGTFQTVPKQFYLLWTILFSVGKHSLPAIHCLMTSKEEALYIAVLREIKKLIPQFQPISTMSDWEQAAKNAFKYVYPDTKLNGCWFHYTQGIWRRTQKVGLVQSYRQNHELTTFIRYLMAHPFLPLELIHSTYSLLNIPTLANEETQKLDKLVKFLKSNGLPKFGLKNYLFLDWKG